MLNRKAAKGAKKNANFHHRGAETTEVFTEKQTAKKPIACARGVGG
jgi:hypothetical protein